MNLQQAKAILKERVNSWAIDYARRMVDNPMIFLQDNDAEQWEQDFIQYLSDMLEREQAADDVLGPADGDDDGER